MATNVTVRLDGEVAVLCLDGAERMNAIGSPTYRALAAAVTGVEDNGQTRAVVVYGAGRAFSAGADIEEMTGFGSAEDFREFIRGFTDALALLARSRLPIIAAINGLALGGGLELAMACDLRIAARGADPDGQEGFAAFRERRAPAFAAGQLS